jgi:O-antigen/teichoic acid export membrane protein
MLLSRRAVRGKGPSRGLSTSQSTVVGIAVRLAILLASALSHFLVAAELGPRDYGAFVLVLFIQGTATILANFGMSTALSYHLGRDPRHAHQYVAAGAFGNLALAVVVLPIAGVALWQAWPILPPELTLRLIVIALLSVPLRLVFENLVGICTGLGLLARFLIVLAIAPVSWLAALLCLKALGRLDALTAADAWLAAQILSALAGILVVMPAVKGQGPFRFGSALSSVSGMVRMGGEQMLSLIAWWLMVRSDRAIIGALLGAEAVGKFGIATSLSEVLIYIPTMVSVSMFHLIATAEPKPAAAMVQRGLRFTIDTIALVGLVVLVIGTVAATTFLGPEYADVPVILATLLPGFVALAPVGLVGTYFVACFGRPSVNLLLSLLALASQVPLMLILAQWLGLPGAGLATSAGFVTAGLVALGMFSRASGLRWRDSLRVTRADLAQLARSLSGKAGGESLVVREVEPSVVR